MAVMPSPPTTGRATSRTRRQRPPLQPLASSQISPMPLSFLLLPSHRPSGENFLAQCASIGKHPVFKAHPADSLQPLGLKPRRSPVPAKNVRQSGRLDAEPLGHFVLSDRFHDSVYILSENIRQGKARAKKTKKKSTPTGKNRRARKQKAPPRQRWGFVAALSRAKASKTRQWKCTQIHPNCQILFDGYPTPRTTAATNPASPPDPWPHA